LIQPGAGGFAAGTFVRNLFGARKKLKKQSKNGGRRGIRTLSETLPILRHRSQLFAIRLFNVKGIEFINCKNPQHCES
jgi:5'-3' exonuclease